VADPTASTNEMTPPEHTVAHARAIARDLGARLFISPSDLELYDELEAFLAGDAPAMRSALAALDELSPGQLRRRLAAVGTPIRPGAGPKPAAQQDTPPISPRPAAADAAAEDEFVSPWPAPDPEQELQDGDPETSEAADEDSWLREWDREALLGGVEQ
jgi:hypothetical protein